MFEKLHHLEWHTQCNVILSLDVYHGENLVYKKNLENCIIILNDF